MSDDRHSSPRVPRKRRSSGVEAAAVRRLAARQSASGPATPAPEAALASETTSTPPDAEPRVPASRPWRLVAFAVLAVITLVGGGLAAWFGTEANAVTSQPSAQNRALSDPGQTSQVTSQVSAEIGSLFSYDYTKPAATAKAQSVLTGAAVGQYAKLFAAVKRNAAKNKLVVTTKVSNAGVEMLSGDTARVLVFATESDGSAGAATPTTVEAMLAVNAIRVGATWKIEGLDTFTN